MRGLSRIALLGAALAWPGPAVEAHATPSPAGAVDVSLAGCWNSTTTIAAVERAGELCFERDPHGTITGKMQVDGRWRPLRAIKSGRGQVSFVVDGPDGDLAVTARYSADGMDGTLTARDGRHPFRATRKR